MSDYTDKTYVPAPAEIHATTDRERRNLIGITHLIVEVHYSKGGQNFFTGGINPRGYYVAVQPVEKTGDGCERRDRDRIVPGRAGQDGEREEVRGHRGRDQAESRRDRRCLRRWQQRRYPRADRRRVRPKRDARVPSTRQAGADEAS